MYLFSNIFSDNRIGIEGAKYISEALTINSSLTHLDIACELSEMKSECICSLTLFSANNIGDEGAKYISEALTINSSLTGLNLKRQLSEITNKCICSLTLS